MRSNHLADIVIVLALGTGAVCVFAQQGPAGAGGASSGGIGANRAASLDNLPPAGVGAIAALAQPTSSGGGQAARSRRDNPTTSIQDLVRIEGHAKSPLRGIGIVVGLKGTGDAGSELVLARPLAKVYENNGNFLADLKELAKAKSAAIVTISCEIPEAGARAGDTFDVDVNVSHSATSLKGGTLLIAPLLHPLPLSLDTPGDDLVFAFASGKIMLDDTETPTSGRIRGGGQMRRNVVPRGVGASFNLIVDPDFRSYAMTRTLASEINGISADLEDGDGPGAGGGEAVATAVDDTIVHVVVPEQERANPANFVANIMTKKFSPSLIDLPAMVVVNERAGTIIVTGDVEISAVTVGSDRLVVTTTNPAPVATAQNPIVTRDNWTQFGTTSTTNERARTTDLLEAFKALNVPVKEQIQILDQINKSGRLHGLFKVK